MSLGRYIKIIYYKYLGQYIPVIWLLCAKILRKFSLLEYPDLYVNFTLWKFAAIQYADFMYYTWGK